MIINNTNKSIIPFDVHAGLYGYFYNLRSMVIISTDIFIKNRGDFLSCKSRNVVFILSNIFQIILHLLFESRQAY